MLVVLSAAFRIKILIGIRLQTLPPVLTMHQAGRRSTGNTIPEAVHFKNARIDLRIYADISRMLPPHIVLAEAEQQQGLPKLTDFPVMHLMQNRDLQLELDEIKKAVQHDVWVLFHQWHPRSNFHLKVDYYNEDEKIMTSQRASYDNTIQEVINQIRPRHPQAPLERIKFAVIPHDWILGQ